MELLGLKALVSDAVDSNTLYVIKPPPERRAFPSDESYQRAYDEWWTMTHAWKVTNIG